MDVLKKLFEQHFHMPVEQVQAVQGELGGSGRKIIRLTSKGISAIGILYGVREENHGPAAEYAATICYLGFASGRPGRPGRPAP